MRTTAPSLLPLAALAAAVALLVACSSGDAPTAGERQVYRLSDDGGQLEGYRADAPADVIGRLGLPAGSVWSVAAPGDGARVWVHAPGQVLLVDTEHWQVVQRWARSDEATTTLAQR